ncbi:MAG TPA: plastocyanin/azurin family copper-binding protein [Candidatus Binataceae bacterium]|nr:plastocyanin/azurin family copper-binding protein [Candidatus Binataceae bacterium]
MSLKHFRPYGIITLVIAISAAGLMIQPPIAAAKTVIVTMTDKPPTYVPDKLTIPVGTTVEWDNNAKTLHDVTTDASEVQKPSDVSLPPGAKPFDSGFMTPGTKWSYTFTVPGHYKYTCIPHEKDGMVGYVDVTK